MRHGCEDVAGMRRGSFDTVSVVNSALSSLGIHIKVLEVVVEIDGARAKISAEESCMSGEDGGDINSALLAQW